MSKKPDANKFVDTLIKKLSLKNDPALFMRVISGLFILSALRYGIAQDWPQVAYSASAAVLNISILWGAK